MSDKEGHPSNIMLFVVAMLVVTASAEYVGDGDCKLSPNQKLAAVLVPLIFGMLLAGTAIALWKVRSDMAELRKWRDFAAPG